MVTIQIKSAFNGAVIAHKTVPFHTGLVRGEMANVRSYCRQNALDYVIVAFNHHSFSVNF